MFDPEINLAHPNVELSYEGIIAQVNPEGAYVESLMAPSGTQLIMPRDTHVLNGSGEIKDRGGIPVYTPWFGPGQLLDSERQHGFGRNLIWTVIPTEEPNNIRLGLDHLELQSMPVPEAYKQCAFGMEVAIDTDEDGNPRLTQTLTVSNNGHEPFVESSGFHPYFPLPEGVDPSDYTFGDAETGESFYYTKDQLLETQNPPLESGDVTLQGPGLNVRIASEGLPVTFAWTDNAQGICMEPTAAGVANETTLRDRRLQPGDSRTYRMQITFLPAVAA